MNRLRKIFQWYFVTAIIVAIIIAVLHKWYVYLFGIPILAAALINIGFIFIKQKLSVSELKEHHEIAGFIVTTLGAIYGVIVAFTIVNAQTHTALLRKGIQEEAYMAANLYRVSEAIVEIKDDVQSSLSDYLKSVIDQEWAFMPKRKENPVTLEKLKKIWDVYYSYDPGNVDEEIWFGQNISTLQDLNKARLVRVYESWDYLDTLSWLALIIGGIIMIGFLFCFGSENLEFQVGINSGYTFLITFLFMITYQFNHPFMMPIDLSPKSYEVVYNYHNDTSELSPEDPAFLKNWKNK